MNVNNERRKILVINHISKTFPGVKALTEVSFDLGAGEVHALCGENGAGKSTLMNLLAGNLQPDIFGRIRLDDEVVTLAGFADAQRRGISIVYQERSLIDTLSIAENCFANRHPRTRWGLIDYATLRAQTRALLAQLDLPDLDPNQLVATLSPAEKQLVEIGKALANKPRILILDEPTASLTDRETETLFGIVRRLKTQGVGIIYISHRMAEIFTLADRVTVLKDGKHQATLPIADTSPDHLIRLMVGRELVAETAPSSATDKVILAVEGLSGDRFQHVNFQVRSGEVVGLAGLVGAGRSEIARAIVGIDPKTAGTVAMNGQICAINHPADALQYGLGYLPEDRKQQGLFLDMTLRENILAGRLAGNGLKRRVPVAEQQAVAESFRTSLRIQAPGIETTVRALSGGNQQKALLARWLHLNPRLLIVDEPTHGVDVGAKFDIYQLLRQLAANSTGILLISSELPEVLALADRVLVVHNGQIAGELSRAEATEARILALASGVEQDSTDFFDKIS